MRCNLFPVCLATTFALAARAEEPSGTAHLFEFARSGHAVVSEREFRLPGASDIDRLLVERSEEGIGLSLWQLWAPGRYRLRWRSAKAPGDEARPLAEIPLGTERAFLLDVFDDSPDEELHRVRLFLPVADGMQEIFAGEYRVYHSEEDAGRTPRPELRLGPARPGLTVRAGDGGWPVLVLQTEARRVLLRGSSGPVAAVIGMRRAEAVAEHRRYRLPALREQNFLVPVAVTVDSPAGAAAAADGNPDSAWTFPPFNASAGPVLSLRLPEGGALRALRIVPGCAASEAEWTRRGRAIRFSLRLDEGAPMAIDRAGAPPPAVFGLADFALPGKGAAVQTLIVFSERIAARRLSLAVEAVEPGTDPAAGGCLAEVTVLDAPPFSDEAQ